MAIIFDPCRERNMKLDNLAKHGEFMPNRSLPSVWDRRESGRTYVVISNLGHFVPVGLRLYLFWVALEKSEIWQQIYGQFKIYDLALPLCFCS